MFGFLIGACSAPRPLTLPSPVASAVAPVPPLLLMAPAPALPTKPRSGTISTQLPSVQSRASNLCPWWPKPVAAAGARPPSQPGALSVPSVRPTRAKRKASLSTNSSRPSASPSSVRTRALSCAACQQGNLGRRVCCQHRKHPGSPSLALSILGSVP